jgi:trans-aconitate methyltransferase
MRHDEMVALIQGGVTEPGGTWADFGAGSGNFTQALRTLLGTDATLYALDRDASALRRQADDIHTIAADFTRPINGLPPLDGLLVANALHFVWNQREALALLSGYLRPGGTLLVVEYDVTTPRSYIPHPLPYTRFASLAAEIGLTHIRQIGKRKSPSNGGLMVCGGAQTPS